MGRRAGVKNGQGRNHLERQKQQHRAMVSVGLWTHLRNLADDIKAGDASKLSEFQQTVQYAPENMRMELLDYVE